MPQSQSQHTFRLNAEDNVSPVLRNLERNAQTAARKVSGAGAKVAPQAMNAGARADVFTQGQSILGNRSIAGMARASRTREASGRPTGQADQAIRDFDKIRIYLEKNYRVTARTFPEMLQVMKRQGLLTQQREAKMERMLQSIERATQQQTRAIQSQRAEAARAVPGGSRGGRQAAGQVATGGAAVVAGAGEAAARQSQRAPAARPRPGQITRRRVSPQEAQQRSQRRQQRRGMWSSRGPYDMPITSIDNLVMPYADVFDSYPGYAQKVGAYSPDAGLMEGMWEQRRSGMGILTTDMERSLMSGIPDVGFADPSVHRNMEGELQGNYAYQNIQNRRQVHRANRQRLRQRREMELEAKKLERGPQASTPRVKKQIATLRARVSQIPRNLPTSLQEDAVPGMEQFEKYTPRSFLQSPRRVGAPDPEIEVARLEEELQGWHKQRQGMEELVGRVGYAGMSEQELLDESRIYRRIDQIENVDLPAARERLPIDLVMGPTGQYAFPESGRGIKSSYTPQSAWKPTDAEHVGVSRRMSQEQRAAAAIEGMSQMDFLRFATVERTMKKRREIPYTQSLEKDYIQADLLTGAPESVWDAFIDMQEQEQAMVQGLPRRTQTSGAAAARLATPGVPLLEMLMMEQAQSQMTQARNLPRERLALAGGRDVRLGPTGQFTRRRSVPKGRALATLAGTKTPNLIRGVQAILGTGVGIAGAQGGGGGGGGGARWWRLHARRKWRFLGLRRRPRRSPQHIPGRSRLDNGGRTAGIQLAVVRRPTRRDPAHGRA